MKINKINILFQFLIQIKNNITKIKKQNNNNYNKKIIQNIINN